jgi:2-keto-4-pentenoate hydratase/2-oxohepta-3-ene-1,7-dioic acid hydratase in catechol pathway
MRWATYVSPQDASERVGLLVDDTIRGLARGTTLIDLLGDDGSKLADAALRAHRDPAEVVRREDVVLKAPIPRPPSIRDFSSFMTHLRAGFDALKLPFDEIWSQFPAFYFTSPHGVVGTGAQVAAAPGADHLDYELEFAAIVGREGSNLDPQEAEDHIVGYCIFNDWSARDIQAYEMKTRVGPAKTKDWAMSLGPWLVTRDDLEPFRKDKAFDLEMTAHVNGRLYSLGNLSTIYWSFGQMISFASRGTKVMPGDVIGSGTVGTGCVLELSGTHGSANYPWLRPGDEVRLEVEHVGALVNRIGPAPPLKSFELTNAPGAAA